MLGYAVTVRESISSASAATTQSLEQFKATPIEMGMAPLIGISVKAPVVRLLFLLPYVCMCA